MAEVFGLLQRRELGLLRPALTNELVRLRLGNLQPSAHRRVDAMVHTAAINDIDIDCEETRYVLAGATDGTLYIHDTRPASRYSPGSGSAQVVAHVGRSHSHVHSHSVTCVQWYPSDNGLFVTSGMDKRLKVWDANALIPADSFQFEGKVYCHHMSGGHQLIAVATSVNHAHLIDLRSGANTHELRGHSCSVLVCRWASRHDTVLATGGADGKVLLWDVRQAKSCIGHLDYNCVRGKKHVAKADGVSHDGLVTGVRFCQDGLHLLSVGGDGRMRKWDLLTGRNIKAKFPLLKFNKKLNAPFCVVENLVFLPSETVIHVLNADNYFPVGTLKGHYGSVNCCVFNADLQEMYSGGNDRNILIWDANAAASDALQQHLTETGSASGLSQSVLANTASVDAWSDDSD